MEHEAFDPPTDTWVNFWDVNPIDHGGTFVTFGGSREVWNIVEVTPPSVTPVDGYLVDQLGVYPGDIWADPDDPMTDYSDEMRRIVRQFSSPPMLPADRPFIENVSYYAADFTGRAHGRHDIEELPGDGDRVAEYWEMLAAYGVDAGAVLNVRDDQLPSEHRDDEGD
jgi:hypothetical protein